MKREDHLKTDHFVWNKEYNDVHKWIDGCFPKYASTNPYMHWLERHHIEAINKKYGEFSIEYNVAYVHILMDVLSHLEMAYVPRTSKEVKTILETEGLI